MPAKKLAPSLIAFVLGTTVGGAPRAALWSDAQVHDKIIQESVAAYKATGHPCACGGGNWPMMATLRLPVVIWVRRQSPVGQGSLLYQPSHIRDREDQPVR
jgi:hypothetical protein